MTDVPPTESIPKPEEPKEPQQSPQQPQFQQVPPNFYQFPLQGYYPPQGFPNYPPRLCLTAPTLGCSSKLHPSNSNLSPNRRETKSSKKSNRLRKEYATAPIERSCSRTKNII
ncbi:hypothetical protein TVAGG3_0277410, partial [Trichomonas vaginalis G3]|uniref:hypothetical protein n=1 Tax=Trichomonas vaginalis (strain ATCC PRA-98 / G3) TaxID=412133 RepID=UPI0021E5F77F